MENGHVVKKSILDERPLRPPVAGKIRAGLKVLTRAAAANTQAAAIYAAGVAADKSFDAIGVEIEKACNLRNPLTPRNIPYFRVARRDFASPAIADRILELYGEDKGKGDGRQVYRFPAVFAFDDLLQNMPHGLRCFNKSGLRYWSEYDSTGERFCMQYAAPEVKNAKARRSWGGRRHVIRPENGGKCQPESCAQYQARECTLSGKLLFYIPGIPGSSLVELSTTSYYSLQQMRAQLELVAGLRHGRVSGTHAGKPIFYFAKVEQMVTMLDEAGQPTKKKQYLVNLEADVTMVDVMAASERALSDGRRAAAALTGPITAEVVDDDTGEVLPAQTPDLPETPSSVAASPAAGPESGSAETDPPATVAQLTKSIRLKLAERGTDEVKWRAEVTAKHGRGWSSDLAKMTEIYRGLGGAA